MRNWKKFAALALAGVLTMSTFAACGKKDTGKTGDATKAGDATKPGDKAKDDKNKDKKDIVTLKWYMSINPIAADTDKVIAKLNEYTEKKIGVKIDYTVIANPDYKEKMPNIINANEYFDICFTANWTTNYLQFADKGAFMDITELLPKYAKETYDFIPKALWKAVSVNGKIYGVPSYKEMGWQGGLFVNGKMAKEYGIDLTKIKKLSDFTEALKIVKEKSKAAGKNVIGITGLAGNGNGFSLTNPYESLTGSPQLPGAFAVPEFGNFKEEAGKVFNQYATKEYKEYCELTHSWFEAGYTASEPTQYEKDSAQRDNDFKNGKLFSYIISYAPGAKEAATKSMGFDVEFVPLMKPLFETRNAMGGLLALSYQCKHPDKALEFINLLNTDKYVGTLIRHGIEGVNYSPVGTDQVDKTMGGKLPADKNGYDYTFGWQFGTPFNQKWDISYPKNIAELFKEYNASAIVSPHNGFVFNTNAISTLEGAIKNTLGEYTAGLETGSSDPATVLPKFLKALEDNKVADLLKEVQKQLDATK